MKSCLSIPRFLGACLLPCLPFFLQAQADRSFLLTPSPQLKQAAPSVLDPSTNDSMESGFNSPSEGLLYPSTPSSQISPRISDILDFWFGSLPDPSYFPQNKVPIWFTETTEIDRQMRENFSQDVQAALNGEYNHWRATPKGRLALILLLDQFTRHIYRNKPQEFVGDPMARGLVLEGLQQGDDQSLYPIEKAFFYLPLEHTENLDMQNLVVSLYRRLLMDAPSSMKPKIDAFLQYAIMHRRQIASFGRFPHRNFILKRKSTPEEIIFLKQWGKPSTDN